MEWTEPILLEHALSRGQGRRRRIIVRLGFPRRLENKWACAFQLLGWRDGKIGTAYGVDGVQALVLAASTIRQLLDKIRNLSSDPEPYEFIFPRFIPMSYGLDFHRYLCDTLDREIDKKEKQLSKKRQSRKRRR